MELYFLSGEGMEVEEEIMWSKSRSEDAIAPAAEFLQNFFFFLSFFVNDTSMDYWYF